MANYDIRRKVSMTNKELEKYVKDILKRLEVLESRKVKIYDENDQYLGVVQNDELISLLGMFQDTYTKEEDKQVKTVASSMLQGIVREIQITAIGNTSCLSGKVIKIQDSLTKLVGSFYIEEDDHVWSEGQYRLNVNLSYGTS